MKVLGLIPARGGSKGVPGKNKKLLGAKPLIQYTIETAQSSKSLTDLVVSSEDEELIEIARNLGVMVPFVRPMEYATDSAKSIDVVQHALSEMKQLGKTYDAVCLLQPTVPFRNQNAIDQAITTYIDKGLDSLVSVLPVPHEYNPHWVFEPNEKGILSISTGDTEIVSRRQELPDAYHRDGSIYVTSVAVLEQGSFFGKQLGYVVSDLENHINIDTLADWNRAEELLKSKSH